MPTCSLSLTTARARGNHRSLLDGIFDGVALQYERCETPQGVSGQTILAVCANLIRRGIFLFLLLLPPHIRDVTRLLRSAHRRYFHISSLGLDSTRSDAEVRSIHTLSTPTTCLHHGSTTRRSGKTIQRRIQDGPWHTCPSVPLWSLCRPASSFFDSLIPRFPRHKLLQSKVTQSISPLFS
jgi:hypothetical protein